MTFAEFASLHPIVQIVLILAALVFALFFYRFFSESL